MTLHNALTGVELHETKGAAAATRGQVLVASGSATAVYQSLLNNVVHVNALADLPTASGGKHTLLAATNYIFGANVNIGTNFLQFAAGTAVQSSSSFSATVTYTGTVPMLQGADVNAIIKDITFICATSELYNWVDTGGGGNSIVIISDVLVIACTSVGTFDDINTLVMDGSTVVSCTDGLIFLGNSHVGTRLVSLAFLSTSATYVGIDFTGATMKTVNIDGIILTGGAGSIGIKGDASNANITADFIANVSNVQFNGVTTPLSGITTDDFRWNFQGNGDIQDSMPDAMASLTANATNTALSVGVPTLILGTWVAERQSHFTTSTAGRLTYNGERDLTTPVDVVLNLNPVSGASKVVRAFLALNGTVITNSGKSIKIDNGDPLSISLIWQLTLTTTDFLEVFIENETDSVDVLVIDAIIRAR